MKRLVILPITIVSLGLFSSSAWAIAKEAQNAPDFYEELKKVLIRLKYILKMH